MISFLQSRSKLNDALREIFIYFLKINHEYLHSHLDFQYKSS